MNSQLSFMVKWTTRHTQVINFRYFFYQSNGFLEWWQTWTLVELAPVSPLEWSTNFEIDHLSGLSGNLCAETDRPIKVMEMVGIQQSVTKKSDLEGTITNVSTKFETNPWATCPEIHRNNKIWRADERTDGRTDVQINPRLVVCGPLTNKEYFALGYE